MPVRFLYDYASPWAYLADQLHPRVLAGVAISYEPIYLRGLDTFATGLPYGPAKAAYIYRDLERCTGGAGVPFRFPDAFPVNGLYALRAALWSQAHGGFARLHAALWRATWAENRDVSSKAVVLAVAAEAGLDAGAVGAGIDAADVKDKLKAQTAAAQAAGVFGVPTYFVGAEMFWGHDRLDYVAAAARRAMA